MAGDPKLPQGLTAHAFTITKRNVPDNTRPPRHHLVDPDARPTLGVRALMNALMSAIEELARTRSLAGFRAAYKNRTPPGEHVVALISPPLPPP
jgi:hypothetical protein